MWVFKIYVNDTNISAWPSNFDNQPDFLHKSPLRYRHPTLSPGPGDTLKSLLLIWSHLWPADNTCIHSLFSLNIARVYHRFVLMFYSNSTCASTGGNTVYHHNTLGPGYIEFLSLRTPGISASKSLGSNAKRFGCKLDIRSGFATRTTCLQRAVSFAPTVKGLTPSVMIHYRPRECPLVIGTLTIDWPPRCISQWSPCRDWPHW